MLLDEVKAKVNVAAEANGLIGGVPKGGSHIS